MKVAVMEDTKKDLVKKFKKRKKDNIPEINAEKMLDEMSENNVVKKEKEIADIIIVDDPDAGEVYKKKKKKRKIAEIIISDDPDAGEVYKKKKKIKTNEQTEPTDLIFSEESVKSKKKKNKSMQTESIVEMVKIEKVENCVKEEKKKCKQIVLEDTETGKKTNKKKKSKQLTEENDIFITETVTTKKPNKKSKLAEKEITIECYDSDQMENAKVKKKKRKDKSTDVEIKEIRHKIKENYAKEEMERKDSTQDEKKNKKAKSEKKTSMDVDIEKIKKDIGSDKPEPKKKKTKKTPEEMDKEILLLDSESDTISKGKHKKCSKKVNKSETQTDAGPKKRKKKIKEEQLDPEEPSQVEVLFLSEKTGNTDEVNINKERRQALQMEIDQASQPKKPAKSSGLGQWGTAEFGSSEQQQKFLRLMGGFKKGFQPASSSGGGGNKALGRDAQQQLQQGLLGEFERAHSRRMDSNNRGAGLGFAAPSKKFSIDANITRSIRFDD